MIDAQVVTEGSVDDAKTALNLIDAAPGKLLSLTADPAYDSVAINESGGARGARVIVPPAKTASVARYRPRVLPSSVVAKHRI